MASQPRLQQVSGKAADLYERLLVPAMFTPRAPKLFDLAGVRPGERILDVACGTGVVTRLAAARAGRGGRTVALDINPAMLAVARLLPVMDGAPVEWLETSAPEMPLPEGSFDAVLYQQGLQQFPDKAAALREMHRILADGWQ